MDFPSVVFYASPFMCFIGLAHQLTDVKIHLLIHFSSTLAFAAPKTMSNFQYKPDIDTDTLTPEEKNLFFFFSEEKKPKHLEYKIAVWEIQYLETRLIINISKENSGNFQGAP